MTNREVQNNLKLNIHHKQNICMISQSKLKQLIKVFNFTEQIKLRAIFNKSTAHCFLHSKPKNLKDRGKWLSLHKMRGFFNLKSNCNSY